MKPILAAKPRQKFNIPITLAIACVVAGLVIGFFVHQAESAEQKYGNHLNKGWQVDSTMQVPEFSHHSGFYNQTFYLEIKSSNPTDIIYYTTDGTSPNENSEPYLNPILIINRENQPNTISEIPTSRIWQRPLHKIFKGTLIKAIVVRNNKKSLESSNSYFVHPAGRKRYNLPVVNLTIAVEDFFGYKKGIYIMGTTRDDKDFYVRKKVVDNSKWWRYPANYVRRGTDWERRAVISYYEPMINKGFTEKVGVRIHGNASRGYAQKSLRILFRKEYGNAFLTYNIFNKQPYLPLPSFILKGFGQDQTKALFRDNLMQKLIANKNFKLNKQPYQITTLFINAEYWGLFSLQERIDPENLSLNHHIPIDSLAILGSDGLPEHGSMENKKHYATIETFIKTQDLSLESNYKYVNSKIDIENLTDYLIANMYAVNTDWPDVNLKMWRYTGKKTDSSSEKDGRWRWLLADLDLGFAGKSSISQNMVNHLLKSQKFGMVFNSLLKNPEFKHLFFTKFNHHLNSAFATKNVLRAIDELESLVEPEIKEHINRWRTIDSYKSWKTEVELLREFARKRPGYQIQELEELKAQFGIKNANQIARKGN